MLRVNEIFRSIQGESTHAGRLCVFVRLSGCNLNCTYCDTGYARSEGREMSLDDIVSAVRAYGLELVEVTGGEPLLQPECADLCRRLIAAGTTVLVETNGTLDISVLPQEAIRIVDVKCPGSGAGGSFRAANIKGLRPSDECKFVLSDCADFCWACAFVDTHGLQRRCTVIFSPAAPRLKAADLAEWMLEERVPARLGIQLHKVIWGAARGR
jgi:7-carboxy-7-deazaguanine synthase